jgi:hypothetical protein
MEEQKECSDCRYYWSAPVLEEPVCRRGVTFGRHAVPTPSVKTMRDEHWWGHVGCGPDAKYYEPTE